MLMNYISMMHSPGASAHSDSTSATDETRLNARMTPKLKLVSTESKSGPLETYYE
jgi:hypothetical protein